MCQKCLSPPPLFLRNVCPTGTNNWGGRKKWHTYTLTDVALYIYRCFTKKFLRWWVGGRCLNGDLVIRFAKPINMCFIKEISFQEVEKLKLTLQIKCSSAIWLQAIWSSTCFATFFLPMCTNFLGCPQSKVVFYLYDNWWVCLNFWKRVGGLLYLDILKCSLIFLTIQLRGLITFIANSKIYFHNQKEI